MARIKIWRTRDGRDVRIAEMTTDHLNNTIAWIEAYVCARVEEHGAIVILEHGGKYSHLIASHMAMCEERRCRENKFKQCLTHLEECVRDKKLGRACFKARKKAEEDELDSYPLSHPVTTKELRRARLNLIAMSMTDEDF